MDYNKFSKELVTFLDNYHDDTMVEDDDKIYACYNQDSAIYACIIGLLTFAKDHTFGHPVRYEKDENGNDIPSKEAEANFEKDIEELAAMFIKIREEQYDTLNRHDLYNQAMEKLSELLPDLWN